MFKHIPSLPVVTGGNHLTALSLHTQFKTPRSCQSTNGGEHGNPSVLKLHRPASLERVHVSISGEAKGVPESNRRLPSQDV